MSQPGCKLRTIEEHWKDEEASFMRMAEQSGMLTPERIDLVTEYRGVLRRIYYRGASAGLCAASKEAGNVLLFEKMTRGVTQELVDHVRELSS